MISSSSTQSHLHPICSLSSPGSARANGDLLKSPNTCERLSFCPRTQCIRLLRGDLLGEKDHDAQGTCYCWLGHILHCGWCILSFKIQQKNLLCFFGFSSLFIFTCWFCCIGYHFHILCRTLFGFVKRSI